VPDLSLGDVFTKEILLTLYRTIKITVAMLLAVQLGVNFTGSKGNQHAFQRLTQQPVATGNHGATSALSGHAPSVSFATLIYQAYP
jgi:hypothetical protein